MQVVVGYQEYRMGTYMSRELYEQPPSVSLLYAFKFVTMKIPDIPDLQLFRLQADQQMFLKNQNLDCVPFNILIKS